MHTKTYSSRLLSLAALAMLLLALPHSAAAAPAFVKLVGRCNTCGSGTSVSVPVATGGVPIGNTVVATFAMDPAGTEGTGITCSDTKGNAYTVDVDEINGSGTTGVRTVICSAPVTVALTNADSVSVAHPSAAHAVSVLEFSGLLSTGRLDKAQEASGSSGSPSSGATATTTQADEVLVGGIGAENKDSDTFTAGSGYTAVAKGATGNSGSPASNLSIYPEYRIVTATGAYAANGSLSQSGNWAATIATYKSKCGNGTIDAGEQCDDSNTATGDCCSASCQFESAATVCRTAANDCDLAETCTGGSATCPANVFKSPGASCGSASDTVCDNPDTCDGSGTCLANNEPGTTLCRADAGDCDVAENCDGAGACPANSFEPTGTSCGSASDTVCDNPDTCNASGTCLSNNEPITTLCRADAGDCDVAENCDGAGACPANSFEPSGTSCGSASDTVCDNPDTCNSTGSCLNNFEPNTSTCRGAAGECDVAELCDGAGACPANSFASAGTACGDSGEGLCDNPDSCDGSGACDPNYEPSTTVCRPDAGDCDVAETCDGAGSCPANSFDPAGTACGDPSDTVCDNPDTCSATGSCLDNFEPGTTECRGDAGECDVAESCDGAGACPADAFEPAGTACGDPSDTVCDDPDTCNATGSCLDNFEPGTTECRGAAGECDVAEFCDGAGACPLDSFEAAGTACGDSGEGLCDNPDTCDGSGACDPNYEPSTTVCRPDAGECDVAELCDGAGACPANTFEPVGRACGDPSDTVCDDPDTCSATGTCLDNYEPPTTECRGDAGECDVAESCDGAGSCPADSFEPSGTACGDASDTVCDNPDTCDASGACLVNHEPTTTECRADAGDCDVAENCDGAGACPADAFEPAATACGDATDTVCDNPDSCDAAGTCLPNHEPTTTECRADAGDCDVAENCDGAGVCPDDAFEPAGTSCGDASDTVCDNPDSCDAAGVCLPNYEPAATECRPDAGDCDVAESCDGAGACPADAFEPAGTACGDPGEGLCDHPDSCGASGTCNPNFEASTTVCRPDAGDCDVAENCDGLGACPADAFEAAGTACGDATDTVCDNPDSCDAAGTCQPNPEPVTTECRAALNDCDVAEQCDGAGACPADAVEPAGTVCGDPSDTDCDDPDTCDGAGTCAPNFEPSTTECRPVAGDCDVAENCTGASAACPADGVLDAGMNCRDAADSCDAPALCDGTSAECPANDPLADGTSCDDGDACTGPDVCEAGACTTTSNLDLCVDNRLCYKSSFTGFAALPVMTLTDFETIGAEVKGVAEFCTAADRDGEGIGEEDIHLVAYKIKTAAGWPKHSPRTLVMHNDLGDISLTTVKPEFLLVPSAEDPSSVPPPPAFNSHGVDHYKCYKAKVTKGTAGLPKGTTVAVADLFSTTRTLVLKKPKHVCTPVDREGDGIKNADGHLVCYQGKPAKGQPKHTPQAGLHVTNPQSELVASTVKEAEVCIPSTRLP